MVNVKDQEEKGRAVTAPNPEPSAQPSPDPKMEGSLKLLVDVQPLTGSGFKFIGRCKKCGWQTMQQDQGAAEKLVMQHAESHWPEIQAHIAEGGSAESASQPKRQEEPTGKRL